VMPTELRSCLFMPALVAIVYNPVIKYHYQKLLTKGKPKMLAVTAFMGKLLIILQAMLKNKKSFNQDLIPLTGKTVSTDHTCRISLLLSTPTRDYKFRLLG